MDGTETYIFAGGGSGGHLFPGIAVADELRRRNPAARMLFVGSERPVENLILEPTGYEHHALPVESLRELRHAPLRFFRRNWSALSLARQLLRAQRPRWVIGLGGFVSAPTVWSAGRLGIPVVLIEQNVIPGAATRWLAGCARQMCLSFDETRGRLRRGLPTKITGNPVRNEILAVAERRRHPGTADDRREHTLLILGGSQGAESLNDAVIALLPELRTSLSGWRIVHQTGPGRSAAVHQHYLQHSITSVVEDFFPNMAERYAAADLVISRAGATTLAELACVGCPSLLIPYPFAADQHQAANAEVFARHGAALVVSQSVRLSETAARLKVPLQILLTVAACRERMSQAWLTLARPDAAGIIADVLERGGSSSHPPATRRGLRPSLNAPIEELVP